MKWYSLLLHLAGILLVLVYVYLRITREREGPVLVTFSESHGLHSGDIPVLVFGGILVAVLGLRIVRRA